MARNAYQVIFGHCTPNQGCHECRFRKSRGCNCYDFLHLDCQEFSIKKLSEKIIRFLPDRFKLA